MDAAVGSTAVVVTGVIGFVTILGIYLYYRGKQKQPVAAAKVTSRSTPATTKSKKTKKKSKASAASNNNKATAVAPAPVQEPEPAAPEPVMESKGKKKKKKKNGATAEPDPVVEVKQEEPPAPEPMTKSQKKRNKKKATAAAAAAQPKAASVTDDDDSDEDDSDDDMMEQAARLLAMKKKGKAGTKSSAAPTTNGSATPAAATSVSKPKASKNGATDSTPQPAPEVELDIGSDAALLIGPGGSTIQNITTTSGAKLDILKNTPEFGLHRVRITAPEEGGEEAVAKAVEMVQALLDERAAILANSKTVQLSSNDINGQAGVKAIIGRKGETIQSILKKCNGETNGSAAPGQVVKINANVDAGTVEISGPKNLVDMAVKLCKQAVFGETQATVKLQSRSAMNIVFGKDFKTIQELQKSSGAKLDMDKETCTLNISGKKEEVDAAKKAVTAMLDRCRGITMDIKSSDVGAVYGKGGSIIRNIQDKTGAFIEVQQQPSSTTPDGESMVKCSIMGEPDACAQAMVLINKAMAREVELKPGEVAETLNLGGAATAAVIGKGGSKIKELEATHKVTLNVNGDVCKMFGKEANVKAVKEAIHAIIDPILATEAAEKEATKAAESGDSTWQAYEVPPEEDGW